MGFHTGRHAGSERTTDAVFLNSPGRKTRSSPTCFALLLGIGCAPAAIMIDVALSILALIAGGLTLELFAATWPPLGHAEERGYKYPGKALETVEELQIGNPS